MCYKLTNGTKCCLQGSGCAVLPEAVPGFLLFACLFEDLELTKDDNRVIEVYFVDFEEILTFLYKISYTKYKFDLSINLSFIQIASKGCVSHNMRGIPTIDKETSL